MSKTFKMVLVLLIVASVISSVLAVLAYMGKEREYMKRIAVEDKLAATLKEKRSLEKELETVNAAKEQAEAKIAKIEDKVKELYSQVDEEKAKGEAAATSLEAKVAELGKLKTDLEKEKKEKLVISKKLDDLQFDYERVKKEVTRLNNEKMDLEKRIKDLREKESVNLDKIVVNTSEAGPFQQAKEAPKPLLQGRVLVVNKEYSFIVVDIGQDKGVQKGTVFEVMDGNTSIGKAEIDKVYDTMSSATVLAGGRINDMKKGNAIVEVR